MTTYIPLRQEIRILHFCYLHSTPWIYILSDKSALLALRGLGTFLFPYESSARLLLKRLLYTDEDRLSGLDAMAIHEP